MGVLFDGKRRVIDPKPREKVGIGATGSHGKLFVGDFRLLAFARYNDFWIQKKRREKNCPFKTTLGFSKQNSEAKAVAFRAFVWANMKGSPYPSERKNSSSTGTRLQPLPYVLASCEEKRFPRKQPTTSNPIRSCWPNLFIW